MKASDLFVRCLENEGVEYIFGVPGEENADLMISLLDSRIRFVVCRHEQAAAFMADAYGRMTGRAACCLGTLGPGGTNLLTGVGNANMDRSPLVVITGQAATTRVHKESHQAMDLVALFDPCVKWGAMVQHPDSIPEIVRKAFRLATTDKFGACHIDLPENIAKMETLSVPIPPEEPARSAPNPDAVSKAASILRQAKRPLILSGNGVLRNRASEQLRRFAREFSIPVVNTFMGKGAFPPSDPLYLFTVGLGSRDFPALAIERADCVIAAGFDMVEYHPKLWNRGNLKQILHIDQSPAEVDENYRVTVEVVGDIGLALDALCAHAAGYEPPEGDFCASLRDEIRAELTRYDSDDGFPVKPQRILADVRAVLDDRDLVLSDVGAHKMWIARHLHTEEPNTIQISNGFCSMGFALPGAIGAKLACPDRRVLAICGDGGVLMNIQDLETAVREQVDIVVMVWTDSEYGLIKWKQEAQFGRHSHIAFTNPDWMKLADAFGMRGIRVGSARELRGAIEEAFRGEGPALIEVPVDYAENMKLTRALREIPIDTACGCLDEVPLFKGLPEHSRRAIVEEMGEARFKAGETVFSQGDTSDTVYVVYSGKARVVRDGREVRVVEVNGGFGEMAALSTAPRTATVEAVEDLVCGTLDAEEFRELLRAQPELGIEIAAAYARQIAED